MNAFATREENWQIEEVGVGARDVGKPVLWFTVSDGGVSAALQVFRLDSPQAQELLSAVYDARELNGRLCRVEIGGGAVRFLRLLKAPRR